MPAVALTRESTALDLMKRPELDYRDADDAARARARVRPTQGWPSRSRSTCKYSGYVERQREDIDRQRRHEDTRFPDDFRFAGIPGLSAELQGKLAAVRPETLGQAQRIPGMTPAALSLLLVQLSRARRAPATVACSTGPPSCINVFFTFGGQFCRRGYADCGEGCADR